MIKYGISKWLYFRTTVNCTRLIIKQDKTKNMGITTREFGPNRKGSKLTTAEMDENFNYLNSNIKPYEVYTALLTQSGGDNPQTQTSGVVQVGVSYIISLVLGAEPDWDFSNVGGPIAPDNFVFVATSSDVPNNYGSATLNYNTGAPVVTVLENTIGNIWFTYNSNGNYSMNSIGLLPSYSTWGVADCATDNNLTIQPVYINVDGQGPDVLYVVVAGGDDFGDNVLRSTPIEIRVYN